MTRTQFRRWYSVACVAVALLAASASASTQELYGSVVGTVQDNSGGVVPGAAVALANRETNLVMATVSNETGAYTFANVLPGIYDVKSCGLKASASRTRCSGRTRTGA